MSAKQVSRREFLYLAASATAGAALVACQPQTVVIEKEVEKEVTKVVEKVVEKEVTTIVEKQVTTVVEKEVEKVVTATPLPTPEALHEAPALHQLVTGSALPPLEERLPADSLVVQPLNMIGTYGGTLRGVGMAPMTSGYGLETIVGEYFLKYNPDLAGIIPNIAKAWDASDKADLHLSSEKRHEME